MENIIFALGPSRSYLFNAPVCWQMNNIPVKVEHLISSGEIADFLCATFGGEKDNSFFVWKLKDASKDPGSCWGPYVPSEFKSWLLDDEGKKPKHDLANIKVTLGPGNSFIAWSPDSVRWSNIPRGLEKTLQSWLTPAGWKSGPPRIIALGADGAYFAVSEYGSWAYNLSSSWTKTSTCFKTFKESGQWDWGNVEYMCLDPATADCFTLVWKNTYVKCSLPDQRDHDAFCRTAESFASQAIKEFYQKERAEKQKQEEEDEKRAAAAEAKKQEQQRAKKAAEEAKAKAAEEARKREEQQRAERAAEEAAKKAAQEREAEMQCQYELWLSICKRAFNSSQPLRVFPQPPERICVCNLIECTIRKDDSGLIACKHDFETMFKASGQYSKAWLRTERNAWHPDHFGRKCETSCRKKLQRQAQEVFTIFGELIEKL